MDQKNQQILTKNRVGGSRRAICWGTTIAAFLFAAGIIFFSNERFSRDMSFYVAVSPSSVGRVEKAVRLTIDFGDGKRRAFEGVATRPITAEEALRFSGNAGGFSSSITLAGEVVEIGGISPVVSKKWRWYLNGEPEERPMLDVLVRGGDRILVKYE